MLTKAPKGTKDVMPDQIYKWQYVERKFKEQAEQYGFKEIRTPMFEHTELFKRGVGDTSDVVQKEMFTFEDRGRRDLADRVRDSRSESASHTDPYRRHRLSGDGF